MEILLTLTVLTGEISDFLWPVQEESAVLVPLAVAVQGVPEKLTLG